MNVHRNALEINQSESVFVGLSFAFINNCPTRERTLSRERMEERGSHFSDVRSLNIWQESSIINKNFLTEKRYFSSFITYVRT